MIPQQVLYGLSIAAPPKPRANASHSHCPLLNRHDGLSGIIIGFNLISYAGQLMAVAFGRFSKVLSAESIRQLNAVGSSLHH